MEKYRKKPVVIDAWQWNGQSRSNWPGIIATGTVTEIRDGHKIVELRIKTLEGEMRADRGDWFICGVKGELYPCKPDIFAATYERA